MAIMKSVLTRGKSFGSKYQKQRIVAAAAITTGQTLVYDVDVSDFDNVTILASLTAAAITDLVLTVCAFDTSGVVHLQPLSPSPAPQAQTLSSGHALAAVSYDLRGVDTIEIQVKNANAGSQTITFVDMFAAITGGDVL